LDDTIREDEMGGARSVCGEKE